MAEAPSTGAATAGPPSLRQVAGLARYAPGATAAYAAWAVLVLAASLLLPVASAGAIDRVAGGRPAGTSIAVLGALLLVQVVGEVAGGLSRTRATSRVVAALRHRLLRHVLHLGVPAQRRHATGDLVSRLTGNAASGAGAVVVGVNAVVAVTSSTVGLVALWLIDWRLGAVFVLGLVPAALLMRTLMAGVTSAYGEYLARLAAIAARLSDALAGGRTIRACGTTTREVDRVLAPLPELARAGVATWNVQRAVSWQVDLVITGVRVAVLVVAGLGVAGGRLSPGEFLAAALYLTFALGLVEQVDYLMYLGDARANAGRVLSVLAEPGPPGRPGGGPAEDAGPVGRHRARPPALSLQGVRLCQGDRVVLDGVDLDIPVGAGYALVGRSGAGKSTLALLVGRLLEPDAGQIEIDGVPVTELDPAALRREVSYAFDRPVLLGGTVAGAVGYARPDAGRAEVERAAGIAQALDFVRRLPDGFDTPLDGAPFSGGELQRLGLARAVLHGGRILVLDDATSSLDTSTEATVADALTVGLAGRTRLMIAHRATTAARADRVVWLDHGRVRAVAPHRTLWATEPQYREIFAGPGGDLQAAPRRPQPEEMAA